MLAIRLTRTGKTAQPSFRIIVQDKRTSPKRKYIEMLGYYLPARAEKVFSVNEERMKHWLTHGAHPSDSVASLLKKHGFSDMEKFLEPRDKKRKAKGEETQKPASETPAPAAPKAA